MCLPGSSSRDSLLYGNVLLCREYLLMRKPSPEEKVARHLSRQLSVLLRFAIKQTQLNRMLCGAVTEEGKRCASKIERSAKGQVRLPSSVTLPPQFTLYKTTSIPNRLYKHYHHHRQCATFSSGEGFHSIRRFPHCKTFSLHCNICRYCPDRGKPCHYD